MLQFIYPLTYWRASFGNNELSSYRHLGGAVVKNPPANAGDAKDTGSSPGLARPPGVGNSNHFSILAGKSQGQRTLAVYPPWVCKEWDTRLTDWTLKKSTFVIAWRLWLQSKRLYSHGHLFHLSHLTSQSLTPLWSFEVLIMVQGDCFLVTKFFYNSGARSLLISLSLQPLGALPPPGLG